MRTDEGEKSGLSSDILAEQFHLPSGKARQISIELHQAILEHRIMPGMKLAEDEVGELFGASRTIARSALQALSHSGLVTIEPNRGAFVTRPTVREAKEVFEARGLIEPRVARMAAPLMTRRNLATLRSHIREENTAVSSGNRGLALFLSGQFHCLIADIADHRVLGSFVRSLISRSSLIIALYWRRPDTTCERHSHDALLNALADGDEVAAEEIMRSHIIDLHSGLDLTDRESEEKRLADLISSRNPVVNSS